MTASKTTAAASKLAAEATKTAAQLKTFKKHPPEMCARRTACLEPATLFRAFGLVGRLASRYRTFLNCKKRWSKYTCMYLLRCMS